MLNKNVLGSSLEIGLEIATLPPYDQLLNALQKINTSNEATQLAGSKTNYPHALTLFLLNGINLILTKEFVDELYKELRMRSLAGKPMVEICAGKGKLSYHLQKRGLEIVATDDYSKKMERDESLVERVKSCREALEKYKPSIVIASWIPMNLEIGNDVLQFPTVNYFIDIGESRGNATWLTNNYKNEKFKIKYLKNVARYAIGTSDYFATDLKGGMKFVPHTQVRLWERKGAPMSIDYAVF